MSKWQLFAAGHKPAGLRDLAHFLEQHEAGALPRSPEMDRIAAAFRAIFKGTDAGKALRVVRGVGQKLPITLADRDRKYGQLLRFIEAELAKDKTRGATTRAIRAAAAKFHKGPRRIEAIWGEYQPTRRALAFFDAFNRETAMIRAELTPDEIARWGDRSGVAAARLARARRARKTKSK